MDNILFLTFVLSPLWFSWWSVVGEWGSSQGPSSPSPLGSSGSLTVPLNTSALKSNRCAFMVINKLIKTEELILPRKAWFFYILDISNTVPHRISVDIDRWRGWTRLKFKFSIAFSKCVLWKGCKYRQCKQCSCPGYPGMGMKLGGGILLSNRQELYAYSTETMKSSIKP